MKKLILIVLSAALLLSACGQATEAAPAEEPVTANTVTTAETASSPKTTPNGVDKAETVYAKANADGTVTETTVEVTLKAQDGQTIPDAAALRDITNKEGDEDYTCGADNGLTWQNHGTSITYEGKSDAALPVTTRVTYYLDGQEIAPGALADGSAQLNDASAGLYSTKPPHSLAEGERRLCLGMEKNGGSLKVHPRNAAVYTATTSSRVGVIWLVDMQVSCSASSASAAKSAGSTLFSCARFAGMPTPALS